MYLDRSEAEAVVGFTQGAARDVTRAASSLGPQTTLGPEIPTGARIYRLIAARGGKGTSPGGGSAALLAAAGLQASTPVDFIAPVYHDRASGARLLPTDEVVVRARPGQTEAVLTTALQAAGLSLDRRLRGAFDEFVVRIPAGSDPVEVARLLHERDLVEWAEPNFLQEYRKSAAPNDPLFQSQWHLSNPARPAADVGIVNAWDVETGDPSIVIAIVDDGVDVTHEDLAPNIFVNSAEIPGNGFDDDQNGLIDDVRGWDFASNDNNAAPAGTEENHGTAVAGIAAGRGGNGIGITGACQSCRILPVKIVNATRFAPIDRIAEAIRYAASVADVINTSWGGGAPSTTLASALQFAHTQGRHGKGSIVISAAGNDAGGNVEIVAPSLLPAGTHRFRWTYEKDATLTAGDDAAWLATVIFPGGEEVRFTDGDGLPPGWQTGGFGIWRPVDDPLHADEGSCWTGTLRSGSIADSQSSWVEVVKAVPAGDLLSLQYVSSEPGFDGLRLEIDLNNDGTFDLASGLLSGVAPGGLAYPAAYPEAISVGASSDLACRSHYSQAGLELDFLAPGSAGFRNRGIRTTDRTGAVGYGPSDYIDDFGGTSSATPLAAGVAGLLLSRNPELTPVEVRQILRATADPIGPVEYINGRNERYGSGRLNAWRALAAVPLPGELGRPVIIRQPGGRLVPFGESARLSIVAWGPGLSYQWYRGASGDTSALVAGATASVFDTPAVTVAIGYWVRVTNANGSVDSSTAVLEVGAAFDAALRVPHCAWIASSCDSGSLLSGRGTVEQEPNRPNTLRGGFPPRDDSFSTLAINRIDRIRVVSASGDELAAGEMVRVEVDTVTSLNPGHLELSYSANPRHLARFASPQCRRPSRAPTPSWPRTGCRREPCRRCTRGCLSCRRGTRSGRLCRSPTSTTTTTLCSTRAMFRRRHRSWNSPRAGRWLVSRFRSTSVSAQWGRHRSPFSGIEGPRA